jgi:chromosome partitioning protein
MPVIIAMLNIKGGTGKSTLAINLGTALERRNKTVVIVDADVRASSRHWALERGEGHPERFPTVITADHPELLGATIKAISADYVIIDTPGSNELVSQKAIGVSHIALIVMKPSALDVWQTAITVGQINQKRDLGGQIEATFLINCVASGTKLSKEMLTGDWNSYGIPMLETAIGNRVQFAETIGNGESIFESKDTAGKAEIESLVNELEKKSWL